MRTLRILLLSTLLFTTLVHADSKPDTVVQEMLQRLKADKNPAIMLEYVHWESAWRSFPQNDKQAMGVANAAQFRSYFEAFFQDPKRFVREQMLPRMNNRKAPGDDQASEAAILQIASTLEKKRQEMKDKMSRTKYDIGKVTQQGDAATVEIVSELDGKVKKQSLPLQKINGRWYLPTMKFIQPSKTSSGSAPLGRGRG